MNNTTNTMPRDEMAMTRMLLGIRYTSRYERAMDSLVERFSVRPHQQANPGMNPDSDEFIDTLPEMPRSVCRVYDMLNRRHLRLINRWAEQMMSTGNPPSARFLRPVPVPEVRL